jgi:hypothetical protein
MLPERHLLPFGADNRGACLFAFDTRVRLSDGELPVIAWMGGLGMDCRCFTGFLATVLQLCRAELAQVKSWALPEPASAASETAQKQGFSPRPPALRSLAVTASSARTDSPASSPREAAASISGARRRG